MSDEWIMAELVLRGIAMGALAATGFAFGMGGVAGPVRWAGVLFCASVIAYVLNSSPILQNGLGLWGAPATLLSLGGAGYFWLFVVTLFEDRKFKWESCAPAAGLTLLGSIGLFVSFPIRNAVWILHNVAELSLAAHAFFVIYRSWKGDLVDERRRVRGSFLGLVTCFVIVLSAIEIGESLGVQAPWYSFAGAVALSIFCLAGTCVFVSARVSLLGAASPKIGGEETLVISAADRLELQRLNEEMNQAVAWKIEGLTIVALAVRTGIPEHRLRRLINDHLGHRNFASFINSHRIEAAKRALADPADARKTVAAIAFDLGYASLGPFNRAFKEETGLTPTQWRKTALEQSSPNSEISL